MRAMPVSPADFGALDRTIFAHANVGTLSAMVVGVGALGNEVARQLGLLGVRQVTLVDPDTVEPSNLPRSVFFWSPGAVGRHKAAAARDAAEAMFPTTTWIAREVEVADIGYGTLERTDLLFSCVDSDLARFEMAYLAKWVQVTMIDAGLGRDDPSFGRVSVFPGRADAACFGCLLGPRKRRELFETWHSTLRSCSDLPLVPGSSPSTPTMAAIVGALQVEAGLRHLLEPRETSSSQVSRSVEIRVHPHMRLQEFTTEVSVACPFHRVDRRDLVPMPDSRTTFGEFLIATRASGVVLDWPICLRARCLSCEAEWTGHSRLATLRRRGSCRSCGSTSLLELDVVRAVERDSPLAALAPTDLGLPADHRYRLRFDMSST
jgi:molybdopterin/thiamine biosynthesis adenylyltransferase